MPLRTKIKLPSVFWMVLAAFLFAVMGVFVKMLRGLPAWEVTFFRGLLNVVLIAPWVWRLSIRTIIKRDWAPLLLRGIAGGFAVVTYFYALEHLKLADAAMLNNSSPILVLVLSSLVLKERLSGKALIFIALAFVGVGLIIKPDFVLHGFADKQRLASLLGFASAFLAAVAYVSIKVATRRVPSNFIVFSFAIVVTLMSLGPTLAHFTSPTLAQWLLLGGAGGAASAAQAAMTRGYAELPASIGAPLLLFSPLFAAIFGWALWGEIPDHLSLVGSAFLALGLIGAYRFRYR